VNFAILSSERIVFKRQINHCLIDDHVGNLQKIKLDYIVLP
jgi:hypothetical protein